MVSQSWGDSSVVVNTPPDSHTTYTLKSTSYPPHIWVWRVAKSRRDL